MQIIRIAVDADISAVELSEFEACLVSLREAALHRLDAASAPTAGSMRPELPPKKPKGFKKNFLNLFTPKRKAGTGIGGGGGTLSPSYNQAAALARGGSLPRGSFAPSSYSRPAPDSLIIPSRFEARAYCAYSYVLSNAVHARVYWYSSSLLVQYSHILYL